MSQVVIIDFGLGNTMSVIRGIERVGLTASLSADHALIKQADRVILPGVGAFAAGVQELKKEGLADAVVEFAQTGRPLLGICLGMQMLLDVSHEFGEHQGLGLIPGQVVQIPQQLENADGIRKIPHIGWSTVSPSSGREWQGTLMSGNRSGDYFYFVHSYMAQTAAPQNQLASCEYKGLEITAAIQRNNVMGCQFHPEKSGPVGLKLLQRFVTL